MIGCRLQSGCRLMLLASCGGSSGALRGVNLWQHLLLALSEPNALRLILTGSRKAYATIKYAPCDPVDADADAAPPEGRKVVYTATLVATLYVKFHKLSAKAHFASAARTLLFQKQRCASFRPLQTSCS